MWRIWRKMRVRGGVLKCKWWSNSRYYKYYRHVFVCPLWAHHFKAFEWWAKRNGYRDDLTLDRLDSLGGYCPSNCRWATRSEQNKNRHYTKAFYVAVRRSVAKARAVRSAMAAARRAGR